jgi:hypothetical protein
VEGPADDNQPERAQGGAEVFRGAFPEFDLQAACGDFLPGNA